MVFVLLGTQKQQFTRLLDIVENSDELKSQKIIAQIGHTEYTSERMKTFKFMDKDEISKLMKEADLIICHAGVGTMFEGLNNSKKVIAVPRYAKYKEHVDDHQLEICEALEKEGYIMVCRESDNLDDIIKAMDKKVLKKYVSNENYLEILRKEI